MGHRLTVNAVWVKKRKKKKQSVGQSARCGPQSVKALRFKDLVNTVWLTISKHSLDHKLNKGSLSTV